MKILVAEDDSTTRLVLRATLEKLGHTVKTVADGRSAWEAWQLERFPLVISDWMMPQVDGLELTRRIRGERQLDYSYIILLTAHGGKSSYFDGMDAGADDFLTKPFDFAYLAARLRVAERILALHDKLRMRAMFDELTELSNRAAIVDGLHQELARSARDGSAFGVMLVDLDRFKLINDTYGHATGDAVLQEVAKRMQKPLRSYDRIGRYGGEEFLIVTPGCERAAVLVIAERVRSSVASTPLLTAAGPILVSVSIGTAVSLPGARQSVEEMVGTADEALYRAKAGGRNRVTSGDAPEESVTTTESGVNRH